MKSEFLMNADPLSLTQRFTRTHYNRGLIYSELNNHEQAIANYNKAVDLDPNFADAYYHRGMTHQLMGNYQLAIKDFEKFLTLTPDAPEAIKITQLLQEVRDLCSG